jgi:hypothetical protein
MQIIFKGIHDILNIIILKRWREDDKMIKLILKGVMQIICILIFSPPLGHNKWVMA